MMMYPFFYRPQSLKLEEGWHLFPLEQYFQQIASQVRDPTGLGSDSPQPCRAARWGSRRRGVRETPGAAPTPRLPQTNQWRLSNVNWDFAACPTYPAAVIVPAAADDDALRKAARFRQGGRFPILSYYHPKNGTVSPSPRPAPRPCGGPPVPPRLSLPATPHPAGDAPQQPAADGPQPQALP